MKHALIAGATLTGLLYAVDSMRQSSSDHDWASRLAHQVLQQSEAFLLTARSEGKPSPLDGVVRNLTQGLDPRVIRVTKIHGTYTSLPTVVSGDSSNGVYELSKILSPDGDGVKITVQIPATGFLGTRNLFFEDMAVLLVFALLTVSAYFVWLWRNERERFLAAIQAPAPIVPAPQAPPPVAAAPADPISPEWVSRQRALLMDVGKRFRSTFDLARQLAVASVKSHHGIKLLRESLHVEVDRLRESQALSAEAQRIIDQIEAVTLNLFIEGGKRTPRPEEIQRLSEQLHPLVRQIRQTAESSRLTLRDLELQLEPWTTDADLAFHAFSELQQIAKAMDAELPAAKATLMDQAQHLQSLTSDEAKRRSA